MGDAIALTVALVPAEAARWRDTVCIVVDELRASSTVVTLLDRGASAVIPTATVAEARRLAAGDGALLAGEENVVRPEGFDFGNSPTEIAAADLHGRSVVLSTRNGTAVLHGLPAEATVLVGCLLNASAVARAALAQARTSGAAIGIVCAGRDGAFALDDALAAGRIVEGVLAAAGPGDGVEPSESARAAHELWRAHPDVEAAFRGTASGRMLARHELDADVAFCAQVDTSDVVPVVVRAKPPVIERMLV